MERAWVLLFALLGVAHAQPYAENLPAKHPAIRYFESELHDAATLIARDPELSYRDGAMGYLPSLLERLGIPIGSQTLVFSKSSFQSPKISPRNPRAIYFNDTVTVGYVPGGTVLEIAATDPQQGVIFYTLDTQKTERPQLARREVCLNCHQGPATQGVPGILVGSVFPNADGAPSRTAAIITDHRTPFNDRWGGWFLDLIQPGTRMNAVAPDPAEPETLAAVPKLFSKVSYPVGSSDPVALLTLEHQTQMTNLLTRLGWSARISPGADIEAVVRYMTFADEAPLPQAIPFTRFAKSFSERGPRDSKGRSLRDFDLRTRLFHYRLSYLIYSPQFDALPAVVREEIYHRLYTHKEIREILRETKAGLPSWWH